MSVRKSERNESKMEVQNLACNLVTYTITKAGNEKVVAKRNRWSLGDRLITAALELATEIDTANTMNLDDPDESAERRLHQRKALAQTFRLMTLVNVASSLRDIGDSYFHWTQQVSAVQALLRRWIDSDRKRKTGGIQQK